MAEEGTLNKIERLKQEVKQLEATETECDHTFLSFQGEDSYYTVVEEFLKGKLRSGE